MPESLLAYLREPWQVPGRCHMIEACTLHILLD